MIEDRLMSTRVSGATRLAVQRIRDRVRLAIGVVGLIVLTASSVVSSVGGQSPASAVVSGCTDCSLVVSRVGRLEPRGVESEFSHDAISIVQDGRGRIVAGPVGGFTSFAVFNATGKLLKVVGRSGAGPGEFRMISSIAITRDDSILVMDPLLQRLSVFSPTMDFVRSIPMPQLRRMLARPAGTLIAVANLRSGDAVGFALHEFDLNDGHRVRSFGEDTRLFGSAAEASLTAEALRSTFVATDSDGALLVSREEPFRVERLGPSDLTVLSRYQPSWLPSPTPRYRTRPGRAATAETPRGEDELLEPRPRTTSLAMLSDGTAILAGIVAAPDWRRRANPHAAEVGRRIDWSDRLRKADGWYSSVIDYFDPLTGVFIGRTRLRHSSVHLLRNGQVAVLSVDDDGLIVVDVLQVHAPGGTRR